MTIQEQLQSIKDSKADIKSALQEQGIEATDTLSTYGDAIRSIEGGGGKISVIENKIGFGGSQFTTVPDVFDFSGLMTTVASMFTNCPNLVETPEIDTAGVTSMLNFCASSDKLATVNITTTENCTTFKSAFSSCYVLSVINGVIDMNKLPKAQKGGAYDNGNLWDNNTSKNVASLSIRFANIKWGITSTIYNNNPWMCSVMSKLDADSRQSFIDALADYSGDATPMQMRVHPDFLANLTDDQKAQATAKGWNIF